MRNLWNDGARLLARYTSVVMFAGLSFVVLACYPGEVTSVAETDLVTTLYRVNYEYEKNATYYMEDSVFHIIPEGEDEIPLSRDNDAFVLARVRTNIEAMGYTPVADPDATTPDLAFVVAATAAENYVGWVAYPPGWWPGWGWGGWGPGWGWYYPPISGVTKYTTGTLFIEGWDPAESDPVEETVFVAWSAAANGLLGSSASAESRLGRVIDQAFSQSQYLDVN